MQAIQEASTIRQTKPGAVVEPATLSFKSEEDLRQIKLIQLAKQVGLSEEATRYLLLDKERALPHIVKQYEYKSLSELTALIYLCSCVANETTPRTSGISKRDLIAISDVRGRSPESSTAEQILERASGTEIPVEAWRILEQLNLSLIKGVVQDKDLSPFNRWSIAESPITSEDLDTKRKLDPSLFIKFEEQLSVSLLKALTETFSIYPPLSEDGATLANLVLSEVAPATQPEITIKQDILNATSLGISSERAAIKILRDNPELSISEDELAAIITTSRIIQGIDLPDRRRYRPNTALALASHHQASYISPDDVARLSGYMPWSFNNRLLNITRDVLVAQAIGMVNSRRGALHYANSLLTTHHHSPYHQSVSELERRSGTPIDRYRRSRFNSMQTIGDSKVERYSVTSRTQFSNTDRELIRRELISSGNYPALNSLLLRSEIDPELVIDKLLEGQIKNLVEPEWLAYDILEREIHFKTPALKLHCDHLGLPAHQQSITVHRGDELGHSIKTLQLTVGFHHSDHIGFGLTHSLTQRSGDSKIARSFGCSEKPEELERILLEDGIIEVAAKGELVLPSRHDPENIAIIYGKMAGDREQFMGLVLGHQRNGSGSAELITAIVYENGDKLRRAVMKEIAGVVKQDRNSSYSWIGRYQHVANLFFSKHNIAPFEDTEIATDHGGSAALFRSTVRARSTGYGLPRQQPSLRLSSAAINALFEEDDSLSISDSSVFVSRSKFWQS